MAKLYEKLREYGKLNIIPMHMPGHKRKVGEISRLDITEIDGFDNLACPNGILKEIEDKGASLYGADKAFISVNGSTGAILSAICGLCHSGDKVIMARNCHKSVYNAVELKNLDAVYIFPDYDEFGIAKALDLKAVEKAIKENKDAKLLILTSPTYEGVLSDIKGISNLAHKYNIKVFVDSAHGAHLKFMGCKNPIEEGADAVCVSLHKTLPSMTQTALLLTKGIDYNKISEMVNVFQTSSPSYVLMASIDFCLDFVEKNEVFEEYKARLVKFYDKMKELKNIKIKDGYDFDKGKIVILTKDANISGKTLMEKLRNDYKIELEMAYDNYALAMTSVCDDDEDFERLSTALLRIDENLLKETKKSLKYPKPKKVLEKADFETEFVKIEKACGRICADYIWAYPPGVPIIAKGELLDEETLRYLKALCQTEILGSLGSDKNRILVTKV